jgi:ABC-type transport system substrate-binding protein
VRIRRGLHYGLDREALRELVLPGFANTDGDSFVGPTDPRAAIVGRPFARYPFDPNRAVQELASAGWRPGLDGRVRNAAGEPVQVEVRANGPADAKESSVLADAWRRLGLDIIEFTPGAAGRDNEFKSKFPGLELRARGQSEGVFISFDSRDGAYASNRWLGNNNAHYANPSLDRFIDVLHGTLDRMERGVIMKEMGEIIADDLPAIALYYRVTFMAVRNTVGGPLYEDYPNTSEAAGTGAISRSAHLWERVRG